jgi:hypothetical protein
MKNNKIIFKYLDSIDFSIIDKGDELYFMNPEDTEYGQIRYDLKDGWCFIYWRLVEEICCWFSLEESDAEEVIGKWVENTLQMRVTNTLLAIVPSDEWVENTLQMRVTNTIQGFQSDIKSPTRI